VSLPPRLSSKEGWRRYVDEPSRAQPERLTPAQLRALGEAAREEYDESRHDWHPNLATINTSQLAGAHESINEIVKSNPSDADRVLGVATIDALPGLGKSTIAKTFGRVFDRADIRRRGRLTSDGHERIPVFFAGLSAGTTVKTLNERLCLFFGHPAVAKQRNGFSADRLASFALDCVLSSETRLGIIDDIHFINPRRKDGLDVTNHLKYLNSEFPVTFIYVGVQLSNKGFFSEGGPGAQASYAQTGRRWTRLTLIPFEIDTDKGRSDWQSLLKATERQLVLTRARAGMLTEIADYLFERSTGHIGSFFSLISRGCYRAIRTGDEAITPELLDGVRIDEASEQARRELAAGFASGRLTTRPSAPKPASKAAGKPADAR
jgi:hypothetical protein